ncbi:MAG: archease [Pseudomonadota bacterium]
MYEIIDHTADIGIRVKGSSLEELFVHAAEAFFDLIVESKRSFIPSIDVPISIKAPSVDQLMVRWLSELLFVFETRRLVLSKFYIDEIDETHLDGLAKGLKFDSTRHDQKLDIKAVTYHKLLVEKTKDGKWKAEIIFDI